MKNSSLKILFVGMFLSLDGGKAVEWSRDCYPLNSEEAASIIGNDETNFYDNHFKWVARAVGSELTCLGIDNTCSGGDFEVSEGRFHEGTCTYTITNVSEGDVMGTSTQITLKRKPL